MTNVNMICRTSVGLLPNLHAYNLKLFAHWEFLSVGYNKEYVDDFL